MWATKDDNKAVSTIYQALGVQQIVIHCVMYAVAAGYETIKVLVDKHKSWMSTPINKAKVYENKVPADSKNDLIKCRAQLY